MDGVVKIGTKLETNTIDKQILLLEDKLQGLVEEYEILENVDPFEGQNRELIKLGNEIDTTRKKIAKLKKEQKLLDFSNINKGITKATHRIAKMALAVFGIRSAFMFVRNAINTIAEDDEQLKADIDYMKNALAYSLEPIVRAIVELAKQLMFYIRYIIYAWFKYDIFENANKSLKKTNKEAKKLQKTLASFDELNVLSDNSSSGSGTTAPSFSFGDMENMKAPWWIEFIAKNKDLVLSALGGIAAGLTAIRLGLGGIKALGIGIAVAGLLYTIQKIIDYLKNPTFDNFIGILEGITVAVVGVAIAFGLWPVALGAAITLVVLLIVQNFDKLRELFQKAIDWLDKNFLGGLRTLFGPIGDILYLPFKYFIELVRGAFESFFGGIKQWVEGVMKIFQGDFLGGIKDIFGGILNIMLAPLQAFIKAIGKLWGQIKSSIEYWKDSFKEAFKAIGEFFMKPINDFIDGIKGLWDKIKGSVSDLGSKIGNALSPSNLVSKAKSGISSAWNTLKGMFGFAKGGIVVPKLASGGIINQPGRGVPIASAVGGERGMEGVIPLTDSQQMELLGEAIGRYITINANITNTMNGRIISRELQKVQNDNDFAYNR